MDSDPALEEEESKDYHSDEIVTRKLSACIADLQIFEPLEYSESSIQKKRAKSIDDGSYSPGGSFVLRDAKKPITRVNTDHNLSAKLSPKSSFVQG